MESYIFPISEKAINHDYVKTSSHTYILWAVNKSEMGSNRMKMCWDSFLEITKMGQ
jgi:hypothetical protein